MKKHWILFFVAIFSLSILASVKAGKVSTHKNVKVTFTNKLTFDSLVVIKSNLQKLHITINYEKIEFDKNDKLKAIHIKVNCNDGFLGSAGADRITNKPDFGFYRNYDKNATSPFGIGDMK